MFPLNLLNYFEIGALLICILCWYKIKNTKISWLLPYMVIIVGVELWGRYLRTEMHLSNAWLYNISVPIEYLFFTFLFMIHYQRKWKTKMAKIFLVFFTVFVLINIFFIQGPVIFNTNILKIGTFFMIIFSCFYFTDIFYEDREFNLLKEPMFWIACGVFLFNTGEFLYSLFSDYLLQMHLDTTRTIFATINNKLILVLYTCISIAALCSRKKRQKV